MKKIIFTGSTGMLGTSWVDNIRNKYKFLSFNNSVILKKFNS